MSTPTIVRKSSNAPNNDQGTTQPTQPVRPTRIIRVLSTKKLGGEAGTTDSNESTLSTNNVTSTNAESTTTTSVLDNDAGANNNTDNSSSSSSPQSNVTKKVVRRVIVKKPTTDLTATTTSPNINNTVSPSTSPPLTQEILTSSDNSTSSTPNNNSTSSTTTPVVTPVIVSNVATTTPPTVTPRTGGVAARWLAMQQNGGNTTSGASSNINTNSNNEKIPATINTNNSTNTDDNNNTPTTTTTTNEPTTPKRIVRPSRPGSQKYESNVASTPSSDSHSTNASTTTTNGDSTSENANSSYADLGSKLKRVGAKVSLPPSVPPSNGTSPHQASKSMTPDIPSNNNSVNGTTESTSAKSRIKDMRSKLETIALLTPEQMLEKKKQEKAGFEKIRPLFQSEISEWYGNSSVTSEDPKYDSSSLEDLKRQAPDINFTSFIYNPLFDEQLACDTPEIQMSSQEILQYNFVIELMKKKYPNLLTLDPITFDEEMRNASNRSSLSFKHSSGRTDSVTTTEDVLSREDIGYPIQKCSKNWKYQLKKKKENSAKVNNNYTEAIFTPRASVQLQSSSPSSPATASNSSVNPLFDHLYYMPCWKHQLQLDQLSMKSHEQKTIQ